MKPETRLDALRRARRESEHDLGEWEILGGVAMASCQRAGCPAATRVYRTGAIVDSRRACSGTVVPDLGAGDNVVKRDA